MFEQNTNLNVGAVRRVLSLFGVMALSSTAAFAQTAAGETDATLAEVVVSGFRASLASALETKRTSSVMVDEIKSEDIADFPDSNLAEAIQRLPGVSLGRSDNGEGQKITVRGLGPDFTTTTVNGMDALATSGGGNSDGGPNRTRGFDFNIFASELFSSLKVQKSASASTDEGSLGATVGLTTGQPLDFGKLTATMSAEGVYYENGASTSPRIAGLIADTFMDNTLGVLFSAAYSERDSIVDRYNRNVGQFEYTYRNSQHAGITPNTFGFARPTGFVGTNAGGVGNCANVAPSAAIVGCGSDPAAYARINPLTIYPTLPTLSHRDMSYERLGLTNTIQWRPSDRTELKLDSLYGTYDNTEIAYELTTVGGNRNLYNLAAATNPASLTLAQRRALYPVCTASATVYCGGSTLVPGTSFSFNQYNLEPYDYYNAPSSPGYAPNPNSINGWAGLVGRPTMQLRDSSVLTGPDGQTYANYMAIDNVDWRNAADGSDSETTFSQVSLSLDQTLTDTMRIRGLAGTSRSIFKSTGVLIELNAVDQDGFVYDERSGSDMPVMQLGFDPANINNWDTVKGLSTIRVFKYKTVNTFDTAKLDYSWDFADTMTLNAGAVWRRYSFEGFQGRRTQAIEAINPTAREAGVSVASLGKMVSFGEGLNLSAGTPTSWFAPNWDAFNSAFDITCNCVNKWSDWRALEQVGSTNKVVETDTAAYAELAFDFQPGGHKLFGNVGLRMAKTDVDSSGYVNAVGGAQLITAENSYTTPLPSFNVAYAVLPDLYTRLAVARVMARPLLSNLVPNSAPGTTGTLPTSCTSGANGFCTSDPSITLGNPYLDPFEANNYDLSVEWYFSNEALLSAAIFYKDILNNPQSVRSSGPLSDALKGDAYDGYVASITDPALKSHINNGGQFLITQQRNAPGGYIRGYELTWQQPFSFLPAPWNNFGVQTNYTHLESNLAYIVNANTGETRNAPYLNASPDAYNATLYYSTNNWEARISGAYRKEYMELFPLASGSCSPGLTTNAGAPCNAPAMLDFRAVKDNLQVDASFSYDFNEHFSVTLEAQNLLNETTRKWVYQDVKLVQQYASTGRIFTAGVRVKL